MSVPDKKVVPPIMIGHFDRNQKLYLQPRHPPVDFAALKGSMTKFYVVPVQSELGKRITSVLDLALDLANLRHSSS